MVPEDRRTEPGFLPVLGIALTAPAWTGGPRLRSLTDLPPAHPAPEGTAAGTASQRTALDPDRAEENVLPPEVRRGWRVLSGLSRLPLGPWRNTCLQRSVVACRCLRAAGRSAVIRIGVRPGRDPDPGVEAHAWVELDPTPDTGAASEVGGYRPLRRVPPTG